MRRVGADEETDMVDQLQETMANTREEIRDLGDVADTPGSGDHHIALEFGEIQKAPHLPPLKVQHDSRFHAKLSILPVMSPHAL